MDVLERSMEILRAYPLCDSCLGRLFAQLGYALENAERGSAIKTLLHMKLVTEYRQGADVSGDLKSLARVHRPTRRFLASVGVAVEDSQCYICGGLTSSVERYAKDAVVQLSGVDFETFAVGTTLPREVLERESEVVKRFLISTGESIKHEINRRIGREILKLLPGKKVDKQRPNVLVRIDLVTGKVDVVRNPLLIEGVYLKLSRRVSQAKKFGDVKASLLEKLAHVRDLYGGVEHLIHVSGREDSDARMLGPGRPLVIEVKNPSRYRGLPGRYEDGDVIYIPRGFTVREEIRRLKDKAKTDIKLYRALVYSENPLTETDLAKLGELTGKTILQYTPRRIKRLSPRKRRTRMVYELAWRLVSPHVFELYIRCQGGLYVKEFIHGDGGRTTPSVAEILNTYLEVLELDVLSIE
ncbi:THUMP domain protein [Pyrobaculum neutrophilum V24Sta]|uniref:tRNA pseudouridine synthase Pus10 n=2 Tax=Pyrobaculum neutrophilum TaxID=70771 RepID=B1Y9L2_PYRNV|nr:tRNA pseudouridine(54/55) synthase Pus10 [Pyrobaculum neutrophilum]ACB40441.1 THUMP domain protein [Pyrobaculum neutrophilum V24Sta]